MDHAKLSFVPIASFVGVRGVPLLALWRNGLNPSVTVTEDAVSIRCFGAHVLALSDLDQIDLRWIAGWRFRFQPKGGLFTYSAVFLQQEGARLARALEGHATIGPQQTLLRLHGSSAAQGAASEERP